MTSLMKLFRSSLVSFEFMITRIGAAWMSRRGTAFLAAACIGVLGVQGTGVVSLLPNLADRELAAQRKVVALEVATEKRLESINCDEFGEKHLKAECRMTKLEKAQSDALGATFNAFTQFSLLLAQLFGSLALVGFLGWMSKPDSSGPR